MGVLATDATLPTTLVTDKSSPPSVFAVSITVSAAAVVAGSNYQTLQAAIDYAVGLNASTHTKITVTAGYFYASGENINLCNAGARTNTGWIYITTSDEGGLPTRGTRVTLSHVSNMFRVKHGGAVNTPVIYSGWNGSNVGAKYFWFRGMQMKVSNGESFNAPLISLSTNGTTEPTTSSQLAQHIVIEQCALYTDYDGVNAPGRCSRGVLINGRYNTVDDCYIHYFAVPSDAADSQCVIGWTGGPFRVNNNDMGEACEVWDFGSTDVLALDDDPRSNIPVDIEFQYNKIGTSVASSTCAVALGGTRGPNQPTALLWMKNLGEIKNAERILINGNYFYNYQTQGDQKYAIAINSRNPDPVNIVVANGYTRDVTFTNNLLMGFSSAIQLMGSDVQVPSLKALRWTFRNNAFIDARRSRYAMVYSSCGTEADASEGTQFFLLNSGAATRGYNSYLSTSGAGATTVTSDVSTGPRFFWSHVGLNLVVASTSGNWVAGTYAITGFIDSHNITVATSPTPGGAGTTGTSTGSITITNACVGGPDDLIIEHNTVYKFPNARDGGGGVGKLMAVDNSGYSTATYARLEFTNNILAPGQYGFDNGTVRAKACLDANWPSSYLVTKNVFTLANGETVTVPSTMSGLANYYPDAWTNVGFDAVPADVDIQTGTYIVADNGQGVCRANTDVSPMTVSAGPLSVYLGASDSTSPGCNMTTMRSYVDRAIAGTGESTRRFIFGRH